MDYIYYMSEAIKNAKLALNENEVPIGCVIVCEGKIIASGYNLRTTMKNSLYHAEIIAINEACRRIGDWRLEGCTMFVTVEPCPMCAGAIVQARMERCVFGTRNKKAGCGGSILNILEEPCFNHQVEVVEGVLADECKELMQSFFRGMRGKIEK